MSRASLPPGAPDSGSAGSTGDASLFSQITGSRINPSRINPGQTTVPDEAPGVPDGVNGHVMRLHIHSEAMPDGA